MTTITMRLIKENKVLDEYAEVDASGAKVSKPRVASIYIRRGTFDLRPNTISVTIQAVED